MSENKLGAHFEAIHFALAKLACELGEKGAIDLEKYTFNLKNNAQGYQASEPTFAASLGRIAAEIENLRDQGKAK